MTYREYLSAGAAGTLTGREPFNAAHHRGAARRVAVLVLALALVATAAEAQLGQRFRVLDQPYEVVLFGVRGFDGGTYEVLVPARTRAESSPFGDDDGDDYALLDAQIGLSRIDPATPDGTGCDGEPTNQRVGGFPANVSSQSGLGLSQSFRRDIDGTNSLTTYQSLGVSVRLDAATCLSLGSFDARGGSEEANVNDRGIHYLAWDAQPTAAELDRNERMLLRLLSYISIRLH